MIFSMNIQDIVYITAIAESGSINKAASELFVAQPSLSKCIQKVEQEYGITLFQRVKGSSAKPTPEGELFLGMAQEILLSHSRFLEQLKRLKDLQKNTLILGLTYQCTADLAVPLLEKFYLESPRQFLQIQTRNTSGLQQGILDKSLDAAMLSVEERHTDIYYEPIYQSYMGICLREGCPAADKAIRMAEIDYPVLRLEDVKEESFVVSSPGSASRAAIDKMLKKNGISFDIIDVPNPQSRIAMVRSGAASMFYPVSKAKIAENNAGAPIYMIHPEQNISSQTCLACLNGFQYSSGFKVIYSALKELAGE